MVHKLLVVNLWEVLLDSNNQPVLDSNNKLILVNSINNGTKLRIGGKLVAKDI